MGLIDGYVGLLARFSTQLPSMVRQVLKTHMWVYGWEAEMPPRMFDRLHPFELLGLKKP